MLIDMRSAPSYCFAMLDFTIVHFAFKAAVMLTCALSLILQQGGCWSDLLVLFDSFM